VLVRKKFVLHDYSFRFVRLMAGSKRKGGERQPTEKQKKRQKTPARKMRTGVKEL